MASKLCSSRQRRGLLSIFSIAAMQTASLISILLLALIITVPETASQIVFVEESYFNVKINMCCDPNLQSGGGSCSSNGAQAFMDDLGISEGSKSGSERQVQWSVPSQHMFNNKTATFKLVSNQLHCTAGSQVQRLNISPSTDDPVEFHVHQDGTMSIEPKPFVADLYSVDQYCVNGRSSSHLELRTCVPSCTDDEPCIHKCCAINRVFSPTHFEPGEDRNCQEIEGTKWAPLYYSKPKDPASLLTPEEASKKKPFIFIRHPGSFQHTCPDGVNQVISLTTVKDVPGFGYTRIRLGENGKIWHRDHHRKWIPIDKTLCVDGIQNVDEEHPARYNNTPDEILMFTCPLDEAHPWMLHEYYGFLPVSCSIFALLTVIVYAILWEKQNIHGYTIMAYSSTVFFLFIFLGVSHLTTEYNRELAGTTGCKIIGTITHWFFISMFAWLTMISFDLWLTFRTMTITNTRSKGFKRFLAYCVFGMGVPTFMVGLSWGLESKYLDDENSEVKVPQYGIHVCYVYSEVLWEYAYGTVAILFGCNLLFFLQTTWKLVQYKRSTSFATKTAQNRQSYFLYVKLFFMVGILWIFEIISWAISGAHVTIPWLIFDSVNCFQPIWIFFIFVFKYDTITSIGDKFPRMKPFLKPALRLLDACECKKRTRHVTTKPSSTDETSALNMTKTTDDRIEMSKSDY